MPTTYSTSVRPEPFPGLFRRWHWDAIATINGRAHTIMWGWGLTERSARARAQRKLSVFLEFKAEVTRSYCAASVRQWPL